MEAPSTQHKTVLQTDVNYAGVQRWMQEVLEEDLYTQAVQTLNDKGEKPSGEDFLEVESAQELTQYGLTYTISRKLFKQIQLQRQQTQASPPETGAPLTGNKRVTLPGPEAGPSSASPGNKRQATGADDQPIPHAAAAAAAAAPALDDSAAPEEAMENAPETAPKPTKRKGKAKAAGVSRRRTKKRASSDGEEEQVEVTPAGAAMEIETPAGGADCAVKINLGQEKHGLADISNGQSGRRPQRRAASHAKALMAHVAASERAKMDDFTIAGELHQHLESVRAPTPATYNLADSEEDDPDRAMAPATDDKAVVQNALKKLRAAHARSAAAEPAPKAVKVEQAEPEAMLEDEDVNDDDVDDDADDDDDDDEPSAMEKDSDYEPESEVEEREPRARTAMRYGRSRANGRLLEEEVELSSDDDDEVEVEEEAEGELFLLPRKEGDQLPPVMYMYDTSSAVAGMRLLLECLDVEEMVHMANTLNLDGEAMRMYTGTKRDPDTGEKWNVQKKRTVAMWRKQLMAELHDNIDIFETELRLAERLTQLAEDEDTQSYLTRYLTSCYRVHPLVDEDGGNLPEVILQMWSTPVQDPAPLNMLLGTKTIHILKPATGFRKQGTMAVLYDLLTPKPGEDAVIKINEKKHKSDGEREAIRKWIKEAMCAPKSQVAITYKSYQYMADTFIKVRVLLKRPDVIAGRLNTLGDDNNSDAPVMEAPDNLLHLVPESERKACDLLALYSGLDMACDASVNQPVLERVAHCEEMQNVFATVVTELQESEVKDEGQGADGLLNVGQMEELLTYCEGQQYDEPPNLKRILNKLRFKLMPYQKQALQAIMLEERSGGTGRHLWVELPTAQQDKYEPAKVRIQLDELRREQKENNKRAAVVGSDDEYDSDREEAGYEMDAAEIAARQAERASRRVKVANKEEHRQAMEEAKRQRRDEAAREAELGNTEVGYIRPEQERRDEEQAPGVRPQVHLFYSALLNAFYWGTSLKDMQRPAKDHPVMKNCRLVLPLERGSMCCLEVGMGKTAVALGAAVQARRGQMTHAGLPVEPGVWSDELLYDGYDGRKGHLHRGGTLVIAPKTLLPQWEQLEITKFLGPNFRDERVVNSTGCQGKKRPSLPNQLAQYDIVMINAEMLAQKHVKPLYTSVMWERVIVDEAHQEPGLMESLLDVPKRSLIMLTGTPVVGQANDLQKMLSALRMPPWSVLARSAFRMGFILRSTLVRYTNQGTQLTGNANLVLPPRTDRYVEVAWGREGAKYTALADKCYNDADQYYNEIKQHQQYKEQLVAEGKKLSKKMEKEKERYTVNHMKILSFLQPLRHACSGGVQVEVPMIKGEVKPEPGLEDEDGADNQPNEAELVPYVFKNKIKALIKCMKDLQAKEPDTKMVIFSCFADTLTAIKEQCEPEGFKFRTMNSSNSMKQRKEALDAFMNDPPTTVFLLSAALASVGLTLVSASHMFLVEPSLNPAQEIQAVGRIHRMGQTKPVTVTRLIMQNSVEARIQDLMRSRAEAQRTKDFCAPANTKAKVVGRNSKKRNDGEDVTGVCAAAKVEELLELFQ